MSAKTTNATLATPFVASDDVHAATATGTAGAAPHQGDGETESHGYSVKGESTTDPIDERATNAGTTIRSDVAAEPVPAPEFISIKELATRLGMNAKTVYRQARKGAIPGVRRVGRGYRAHVPTVLSWFAAGPRRDPRRDRWE